MSYILATCFITFALSFGIALAATPLAGRLAVRVGAVDYPGPRKIHRHPVPRLGGVALYLACVLPLPALYGLHLLRDDLSVTFLRENAYQLTAIALLSAGILILGIYDDIRGVGAWKKFLVECVAAVLLYVAGIEIAILSNPFGGDPIQLGWLAPVVTVVWVVGLTNAINLLDGVDGLAAGVTAFAALTLSVGAIHKGEPLTALLALSVAGATIGFLRHNFPPARIFMGDSGALFLGFFLSAVALKGVVKGPVAGAILVPMVALGVPIWDSLLTVTRRVADGRPIFAADDGHVHHRLLYWGLTQRQVALTLYGVTVLLCAAAMGLMFLRRAEAVVILALLGVFGYVTSRWLGSHLPRLQMAGTFEGGLMDRIEAKLAATPDRDRNWEVLCAAFETLDILSVRFVPLQSESGDPAIPERSWQSAKSPARMSLHVPIVSETALVGGLILSWADTAESAIPLRANLASRLAALFARSFGEPGLGLGPVQLQVRHDPEPGPPPARERAG